MLLFSVRQVGREWARGLRWCKLQNMDIRFLIVLLSKATYNFYKYLGFFLGTCEPWWYGKQDYPTANGLLKEHTDTNSRGINTDCNSELDGVNQPGPWLCDLSHSDTNQWLQRLRGDSSSTCVLSLKLKCYICPLDPCCMPWLTNQLLDKWPTAPLRSGLWGHLM